MVSYLGLFLLFYWLIQMIDQGYLPGNLLQLVLTAIKIHPRNICIVGFQATRVKTAEMLIYDDLFCQWRSASFKIFLNFAANRQTD